MELQVLNFSSPDNLQILTNHALEQFTLALCVHFRERLSFVGFVGQHTISLNPLTLLDGIIDVSYMKLQVNFISEVHMFYKINSTSTISLEDALLDHLLAIVSQGQLAEEELVHTTYWTARYQTSSEIFDLNFSLKTIPFHLTKRK